MNLVELKALKDTAMAEAAAAADAASLEAVRIKYLGRKGLLPEIMQGLKNVDPSERRDFGRLANELKNELQDLLNTRKGGLEESGAAAGAGGFDVSLPGRWRAIGSRHPVTQIIERTTAIFRTLGFTVADGPDIETEYHNFDALNTPADHPSRDTQDTFYLKYGMLLRSQTSPVQIRVMERQKPPVRIIAPGRCYRRDAVDATHSANFHQIEGLYVDRKVSMADLKGDLTYFAKQLMGRDVKVRFRPHFFPFTEPSYELDVRAASLGGGERWLELAGCGMVDPAVFERVNQRRGDGAYDPGRVSGFAFGFGLERLAMILFGVPDIRMFVENDQRFLSQFAR